MDDRIFVLGIWKKGQVPGDGEEIAGINGKVWPHGENVTYTAGDTIHWRVIDPSFSPHGMHIMDFISRWMGWAMARASHGMRRRRNARW